MNLPSQLEPLIHRLGGPQRAMIAGVGLVTVLLVLGLSRWATAPTWIPLFSGIPLETVGQVTQQLEEAGIPFQLEGSGDRVLVQASDAARARVTLAQQGLPHTGRPGLELFDQPSWGMTDFAQRINYRRALEGELERTIGKMRGVEAAKVHLAMDEANTFRAPNQQLEASVVLKLRSGRAPGADVVQGIQHLVASSIEGLASQRVTVVDDSGRLLSVPDEPGSLAALSNRQLGMQQEVENYLERKAEELVAQVVGPGNVEVQVSAAINFDRIERTTQTLDPDGQVLASEQRAEIVPGPEGGAGSTTTAANYENSRSTESFTGAIGNLKRLSVAVLVNQSPAAGAEGAEAAPVARSAEELRQIENLVRSAVGIDEQRGDVVAVASMPFVRAAEPLTAPETDVWTLVERFSKPGITVLALLIAAMVGMRAMRSLRQAVPATAVAAAAAALPMPQASEADFMAREALAAGAQDAFPALPTEAEPPQLAPLLKQRAISSTNARTRNEVSRSVAEHPDVAVRVVRAWLKEA